MSDEASLHSTLPAHHQPPSFTQFQEHRLSDRLEGSYLGKKKKIDIPIEKFYIWRVFSPKTKLII